MHFGRGLNTSGSSTGKVPSAKRSGYGRSGFGRFHLSAFNRHNLPGFALVVDVNASCKEHQAQDQSGENKHYNRDKENRL